MNEPIPHAEILRLQTGEADARDMEVVTRWRSRSSDNDAYIESLERVRRVASSVENAVATDEPPPARDLVLLAELQSAARRRSGRGARSASAWVVTVLGAAAAVVLLLAGGRLFLHDVRQGAIADTETFVTVLDEQMTLRLSDGSVIRLAPRSRLRVHSTTETRTVDLEGRAFFSIHYDRDRPFIVRTRSGEARVLGTRFQAETGDGSVSVVVFEGRVALAGIAHETELEASQLGRIVRGQLQPTVQVPDLVPIADWMGDFIAFQATPLPIAIHEIAGRFAMSYEMGESVPVDRDLTMWFADQSVHQMVDIICAVLGIACSIDDDVIRLGT